MIQENEPTESLCPVCLSRIDAYRVSDGHQVRLEKHCPIHGNFSTVIWRGQPDFSKWKRPKLPSRPPVCHTREKSGCPFDCGLCPDHGQHTCTTLVEVTCRCNLNCPVCFAQSSSSKVSEPDLDTICAQIKHVRQTAGACTLQISGGEPTVRGDLAEIIDFAAGQDFSLVQLNTNGLRFAGDPKYAEKLRKAGLESVFLQFDGVSDSVYEKIRGQKLWDIKQKAVKALARAGIGIVLVPTLMPGINVLQAWAIVDFALEYHPAVRGVHFQPVSYFGRYPHAPADSSRLTLPELMSALETQSSGMLAAGDFMPPGCEHALCSFHAAYRVTGVKTLKRISTGRCCTDPIEASQGARQSVFLTGKRWGAAPQVSLTAARTPDDLDRFLMQVSAQSFTVSAMAFQDVWNLDLERLRGCCIHVAAPDGRLIPFCAYNLTAADGTALYRDAKEPGGNEMLTANGQD